MKCPILLQNAKQSPSKIFLKKTLVSGQRPTLRRLLQSTNLEGKTSETTTRQTRTSLTMIPTRKVASMTPSSSKMYLDIRPLTKQLSGEWLSEVSLLCIATIERGQSTMLLSGSQSCLLPPSLTFGSPIRCKNL